MCQVIIEGLRPRKGMTNLVNYIPKDGRPFKKEDFNPKWKYPRRLSHDSVLYELQKKIEKLSGTNDFIYWWDDCDDSWEVLVYVKRNTKLYKAFVELGFEEV